MFAKTILRVSKILWAAPIVLFGLVWTAVCMGFTFFGGASCAVLIRVFKMQIDNPFTVMPRIWGWSLRQVFFRWAFVHVFVENTARPFMPGERAIIGANHGSLLSMLINVWGSVMFMPNPVRWVIKRELMRWWKIGPALKMIGLAWDIDRSRGDEANAALATMGDGFARGSAEILIEGTRPTNSNMQDGRDYYVGRGERHHAQRLRVTARPRPNGFRTILLTTPHERRIRMLVTSSTHEEGFWGLVDLMFSGAIFLRIEEWSEPLHPRESVFVEELNEMWLGHVQSWIIAKRDGWVVCKRTKWWGSL